MLYNGDPELRKVLENVVSLSTQEKLSII